MTHNIPHLQTWYNNEVFSELSIGGIEKKYGISKNTLYRLLSGSRSSEGISPENLTKIFTWAEHLGYDSQKVYEPKIIN